MLLRDQVVLEALGSDGCQSPSATGSRSGPNSTPWRGVYPSLLTWVHGYGSSSAALIVQPDDVWTHPHSEVEARQDGTAFGVVPLWTTEESPSDLCAEFEVDARGRVEICDVHVL